MRTSSVRLWCLIGLLVVLCAPAYSTVTFVSLSPSPKSPQVIGTSITWIAAATDSKAGPLTFQFNVAAPNGSFTVVRDFNVGTMNGGIWFSQPFVWTPVGIEGVYQVQVVIKDFASGESASKTIRFQANPLVTGTNPVVVPTSNALVALFSAPSCASGSTMRVHFQKTGSSAATTTNWANCNSSNTMTFEIAGMYPSSSYQLYSQTKTGSTTVNGPTITFTTGALPSSIPFPNFKTIVKAGAHTDTTDWILLHNLIQLGGGTRYPDVATDLSGKIVWYYYPNDISNSGLLVRPLPNGGALTIENGNVWNPASTEQQLLRQIDLAGNIVRETNTGIIQQQLVAKGSVNGGPCNVFSSPPPVGAACLGAFHHDAIQFNIGANQFTAVIADVEKIFPPGTQGDTTGLPVDIVGDMIVVLDANWQVSWYFDTFEHASGKPQLDINRPAVLGETCVTGQSGCPPMYLLGPGIASKANDWLHANSIYYWPNDTFGGASGDLLWSSRHQDWVMKIDYNNGAGTGNILWRMGPAGDFTFNNIYNDPWPWFSHQHDAGIENNGTGVLTIFDNGNTRVSPPPVGVGPGNSRGMAVTFDETQMQVTPVLSADLSVYSVAMGSGNLLPGGNYFFQPAIVVVGLNTDANSIQIFPTPGTDVGTVVLNLQGVEHYRGWEMQSLYNPPTT